MSHTDYWLLNDKNQYIKQAEKLVLKRLELEKKLKVLEEGSPTHSQIKQQIGELIEEKRFVDSEIKRLNWLMNPRNKQREVVNE